jgi:hypothetical protein
MTVTEVPGDTDAVMEPFTNSENRKLARAPKINLTRIDRFAFNSELVQPLRFRLQARDDSTVVSHYEGSNPPGVSSRPAFRTVSAGPYPRDRSIAFHCASI